MLKTTGIAMLIMVGFVTLGAIPAETQQTVVGQDNSGIDFHMLQAAVSDGGTILLKGTFNLGDTGRVNIIKDVKIMGETDDKGTPKTKIKGGFWSLHSPLPSKSPPEVPGPKITIQNIHFDGALWAPIHLAYCSGATISNNKITNVRPFPPYPIKPRVCYFQTGILCGTYWAQPGSLKMQAKYQPGAFTGELIISDNEIDVGNPTPELTLGQGIFVHWTTGVTARIANNTVVNCSRNSIETFDNHLDKDGIGMFTIQNNKITSSKVGVPVPSPRTPNGIVIGWFMDPTGAADPKRNNKYIVMNNFVRVFGQTSLGIFAEASEAVIKNNQIYTEGPESTALFLRIANCSVTENKTEGTGNIGCFIGPLQKMMARGNKLVGNIFSSSKITVADIVFDKGADDNEVIGEGGTVNDQGTGNKITGLKPMNK
jgi:hypothetical protein